MKKRKKWNKAIDCVALIKVTDGFNGADLEAVVNETIENAFIEGRTEITTEDLLCTVKDTKSISTTLRDKIQLIRDTVSKMDIKAASISGESVYPVASVP